jgi:hypothetical protein
MDLMAFRRKLAEYEADLYKVPKPRFLPMPKGELEVKRYDDGETKLEIEFFGAQAPDGAAVTVVIDGQAVCQVPVRRQRGRLEISTVQGAAIPDVRTGSVGEIQYQGQALLRGTFKPD